jgi:EAL domain-containing protein (putative c-di-GMP-specific phosphodiesterase class I)
MMQQSFFESAALTLHRQPINSLGFDSAAGAARPIWSEILLRNNGASAGLLVRMAERCGCAVQLDRFVLSTALDAMQPNQRYNINISAGSTTDREFFSWIEKLVLNGLIIPYNVIFEITETLPITNPSATLRFTSALRALGIKIALDDISSRDIALPWNGIDCLKLSADLIQAPNNARTIGIVRYLKEKADEHNIFIVAEGVETQKHIEWIKEMGIKFWQGYALDGHPVYFCGPTRVALPWR